LATEDVVWHENFGLRGLSALAVRFEAPGEHLPASRVESLTGNV
jgi:hypothetical protein